MKKIYFVQIVLLFGLIAGLDILLARNVFMLTEGWWETYAWVKSSGLDLYGDAGLKFPPLYVLLMEFLRGIFGEGYLTMRYVFAGLHATSVLLLYLWLKNFGSTWAALCGTAVATGLVMSNPVYLAKDYHTIVALLINISLVTMVAVSKSASGARALVFSMLTGLACGLLLLTKQNIGVFYSLGVFLYFFLNGLNRKERGVGRTAAELSVFVLVYFLPGAIFTYIMPEWLLIFSNNEAKGSIWTILFRFMLDPTAQIISGGALVLVFLILVIDLQAVQKFIVPLINRRPLHYMAPFLLIAIVIGIGLGLTSALLIVALAWPMLRAISVLPGAKPIIDGIDPASFFPLIALAYCGTLSAGYNTVSMEVLIALFVCESAILIGRKVDTPRPVLLGSTFLPAILFLGLVTPKIFGVSGYNWWGFKAGRIFNAESVSLKHSQLEGISTDRATAAMLDQILAVKSSLGRGDRVFAYPSIPLAYDLLKLPPVGAPVLWFDVTTIRESVRTVEKLNESVPAIIFWLRPPQSVYLGHAKLTKSDPALLKVDEWLISKINKGEYRIRKVILGHDPESQRVIPLSKYEKSVEFDISQLDGRAQAIYQNKCSQVNHCDYTFSGYKLKFSFGSPAGYLDFVGGISDLFVSSDHVFYVLERAQ
jgi:hypothetical protein